MLSNLSVLTFIFNLFRQCEGCGLVFANKDGLDKHVGYNKNNLCGRTAILAKKKKEIAKRILRKEAISALSLRKMNPRLMNPNSKYALPTVQFRSSN